MKNRNDVQAGVVGFAEVGIGAGGGQPGALSQPVTWVALIWVVALAVLVFIATR